MAHKKAAGSTQLGRDSQSKRLGVKVHDGQFCDAGSIIVRQRGTKFFAGKNTGLGKDYTIFAKIAGIVKFSRTRKKNFAGKVRTIKKISVTPRKPL